jgi:gamma-glutamyltranspeptidase/glutathione hydrolase
MSSLKFLSTISITAVLAVLMAVSPALWSQSVEKIPEDPRDSRLNYGPKKVAEGEEVMVCTQSMISTEAALKVLREGGSAVDAAVTAAFLQQVTEPHQVSRWGALTGVYYDAATNEYFAYNGDGERPLGTRGKSCNPSLSSRVSIGGTVLSLWELHQRFGKLRWSRLLEPAIAAAEEGVLVTSFMYGILYNRWEGSDSELLANKKARQFFMPGGHLVPVGFKWKMPIVAEHLRKLAEKGGSYMYTGEWGQKFVEETSKRGGRVTMKDMTEYEVRWTEPLHFEYKGYDIYTEPMPVDGGLIVAMSLNILENFDLKSLGHYTESAETLEIMARTAGLVSSQQRWLEDPLSFHNPTEILLSEEYGKMMADFVRQLMPLPGVDLSPPKDESEIEMQEGYVPSPRADLEKEGSFLRNSDHVSIADAEGNWVSFLHSGHGGAPGTFIDGVAAGGSSSGGRFSGLGRRLDNPCAASIIAKNGKPWMAIGTPGSPGQPMVEVLISLLEFKMHPKEAADAPRFWALNYDHTLRMESRIPDEVRKGMASRGIKIQDIKDYNWQTGSFQIVWRDEKTGKLYGVSDPRRLGFAGGY